MDQRRVIWKKLKSEGIIDSDNPRVQEFVTFLRENPDLCWKDLVPAFRKDFYDCFDAITPVLTKIKDPMVQASIVTLADPKKPKERKLLEEMAKEVDPEQDQVTAKLLALTKNQKVKNTLKQKSMPAHLKVHLKEK